MRDGNTETHDASFEMTRPTEQSSDEHSTNVTSTSFCMHGFQPPEMPIQTQFHVKSHDCCGLKSVKMSHAPVLNHHL